jgi:phosphomannomutase
MGETRSVPIENLMEISRVKFGTSGARGLVVDMTDRVCFAYTVGFLQHLESIGDLTGAGQAVAVAGDLRRSTDRIMRAVTRAVQSKGYRAVNCGKIPSPAVACYGLARKMPAVMVTGSHIPDDRNGIKFNKVAGEILKADEAGFKRQTVDIDETLFDERGMLRPACYPEPGPVEPEGEELYRRRFLDFFPDGFLQGKRVGFYQHSAVGRDLLPALLERFGAEVTRLGRSDVFVPVDTEAIRPEDAELARRWADDFKFDSIFSTDGDSDRPLVSDERGRWLRGDVAGILVSTYLQADSVSTPVSCNTALEKCGRFADIRRTRIGSPYVIEAMIAAAREGYRAVTGYEANGGYLTGTDIVRDGAVLRALPTRDPLIVFLGIMGLAIAGNTSVSALLDELPQRFTTSGRLKEFPTRRSQEVIAGLTGGDYNENKRKIENQLGAQFGKVADIDTTDGLRITFESREIVHLRPSGNAPEFRCYNEAGDEGRAAEMNAVCLGIMEGWRRAE